jgi:hypothetical protein
MNELVNGENYTVSSLMGLTKNFSIYVMVIQAEGTRNTLGVAGLGEVSRIDSNFLLETFSKAVTWHAEKDRYVILVHKFSFESLSAQPVVLEMALWIALVLFSFFGVAAELRVRGNEGNSM